MEICKRAKPTNTTVSMRHMASQFAHLPIFGGLKIKQQHINFGQTNWEKKF